MLQTVTSFVKQRLNLGECHERWRVANGRRPIASEIRNWYSSLDCARLAAKRKAKRREKGETRNSDSSLFENMLNTYMQVSIQAPPRLSAGRE